MSIAARSLVRVIVVLVGVGVGFVLVEHPFRHFELRIYVAVLQAFHFPGVGVINDTSTLVANLGHEQFWAVVTPSCSALPAMLAIATLALCIAPSRSLHYRAPVRLWLGTALAILLALVGNLLRIDISLIIGIYTGPGALVLFHDWIGSIFDFASVIAGWMILLRLQLPKAGQSIDDLVFASVPGEVAVGELGDEVLAGADR